MKNLYNEIPPEIDNKGQNLKQSTVGNLERKTEVLKKVEITMYIHFKAFVFYHYK